MGIYARLVRPAAGLHLWLGKPLRTQDGVVFSFGGVARSAEPLFGPALWKFLAERETEAVTIAVDGELEETFDLPLVGGEDPGDIPYARYLRDDPPLVADYYATVRDTAAGPVRGAVLRRRTVAGARVDEAFTRRLRWEPTRTLNRHLTGDGEVVAISEAEAVTATLSTLAVVSGLRIPRPAPTRGRDPSR